MEPEIQQQIQARPKIGLYIYGSRQSDQFWLPSQQSSSRRPFCLTDVQEMDSQDSQTNESKKILNPLFKKSIYKIACGGLHSIVLTTQGQVFTFGCNDQGALGRKGIQPIPVKVQLQDPIDLISAGDNHSMFANSVNGAVYFSGNYNYRRGEKMTQSIFEPVRIYISQINHSLKNKKIQKISSGHNHSCLLINGTIFCRGEPEAFTTGRRVSARHKVQNSLTFNAVNLSHIVDFQCGGYHTIAKVKKGIKFSYYVWGKNDEGQLGIGSYEDQNYPVELNKLKNKQIIEIAAGTSFSLFLDINGDLFGCGSNEYGNLGIGEDYVYEDSDEQTQKKQNNQSEQGQAAEKEKEKMEEEEQENKNKQINGQDQQNNLHKLKKNNIYIKTIKKIEVPQPLEHISAGSDFAFGWNKNNLYSWGFGTSYVLLNGQQDDEYVPFQVRKKIINQEIIYNLAAGSQHVLYTSYLASETSNQLKIQANKKVWQNLTSYRKLPRKK